MQNRKPHSQKDPQTGHSIFGTILFSLLAVLAVEFLLLTFAVHVTRLGPQLNQNAEDILAMQVDNRSRYLQSIFHDAQELTSLSDAINGLTQQLLDEGEISLSTLDSSSDAAYPLLEAAAKGEALPAHVESITAPGIAQVKLIDATPIGINVRSTVATYANVHDELRKIYARSPLAREKGYKAGDFSYNTGRLRCPGCDGTGTISLDIQFLPDVEITCPDCGGSRYQKDAAALYRTRKNGTQAESLPRLMEMSVDEALAACADLKLVASRLQTLSSLGLGYLTLGEATPSLSGGEAQRLKLASEMGKGQADTVFVFDEPTIGLHPLDVRTLLGVFQRLIDSGATVVVIEHDLDVIRNADYLVDLGPGGGESGGRIVACGTPEQVAADPASITGKYLHL